MPPEIVHDSPLREDSRIGNYILKERVGTGASGEVWKAVHHERPGRIVAVKIAVDPTFRRQLCREGRLPDIAHPNVVPILDSDTRFADVPYIVMPYHAGGNLAALVAAHPDGVPPTRVQALLVDILSGLAAAHQQRVVHGDIKPSNVLLDGSGRALITDFGLSTVSDRPDALASMLQSASLEAERSHGIGGTLAYMAPEIRAGEAPTPSADVYSVGVLLFELLTGRLPCGPERPSEARLELIGATDWDGLYTRACRPANRRFPAASEMLRYMQIAAPARGLLKGHGNSISCMAFSPDGKHLVTAAEDRTARFWDLANRREKARFDGPVWAVAFSPDGQSVALGLNDGGLQLWNPMTSQRPRRFEGHEESVQAVAFSPDGRQLLTGCDDGAAWVWDVATGRILKRFAAQGDVWGVAFSPSGGPVLIGIDGQGPWLWDTSKGASILRFQKEAWQVVVALSPNGRYALASCYVPDFSRGAVRLWDVGAGREARTIEVHSSWVQAAAFARDGHRVAVADGRTVRLWDTKTGREVSCFETDTCVLALSADGRYAAAGYGDGPVRIWNVRTGAEAQRLLRKLRGHTAPIVSAMFMPDGRHVLTASRDGTVLMWDAVMGNELRRSGGLGRHFFRHAWSANGRRMFEIPDVHFAFSADGRQVLEFSDDHARLRDAATWEQLQHFKAETGSRFWAGAFSPDGERVLTIGHSSGVCVWETRTGRQVSQLREAAEVTAATFSPDGRFLFTGSQNAVVGSWDAETGSEVRRFEGHRGAVWAVACSADGRHVLTGSTDRSARLWDATGGTELCRLEEHEEAVTQVAFSPDGRLVLTGSSDGMARLWDALAARQLRCFKGHEDSITVVSFSADGRQVLTASYDWTARLWDVATGEEVLRFGVDLA